MNTRQIKRFCLSCLLMSLTVLLLIGCSKDSSVEPTPITSISSGADAAESIAGAVGNQSGGLADLIGDIVDFTKVLKLGNVNNFGFLDHRQAEYDEAAGLWTVTVERERGGKGNQPYGYWRRVYTIRFLNVNGLPQKHYITGLDTARTVEFNILSGQGFHKNKRVSHELKDLEASFIATNVHTNLITVNGTMQRAGVDTVKTLNMTRISDHTLQLTVTDLVDPADSRGDLSQKISGTISGTFHADIIFDGKRGYSETTVDKTFTIVINNGQAEIIINGRKYICDLESGQIK